MTTFHKKQRTLTCESLEYRLMMTTVTGDFNADGLADLAMGMPEKDGRGAVSVIYGTAQGLNGEQIPNQVWDLPRSTSSAGAAYGEALAVGDFNGDKIHDLAIGAPGQNNQGVVHLLFGSSSVGLRDFYKDGSGQQRGIPTITTYKEPSSRYDPLEPRGSNFGATLAVGDFDGDGSDDLAIGAPLHTPRHFFAPPIEAGMVTIAYGHNPTVEFEMGIDGGFLGARRTRLSQIDIFEEAPVAGSPEHYAHFGQTLAVGDFNGDKVDDLAIGDPNDDIGSVRNAGSVKVLYGKLGRGVTTEGQQRWTQDSLTIADNPEVGDRFGSALAVGDFDGNGVQDLAIGVPGEDIFSRSNAGVAHVIYGQHAIGLNTTIKASQFWHQNTADGNQNVSGAVESNDYFAFALAAGDFDRNGTDDLAIGVPGEDIGRIRDGGMVNVIYSEPEKGLSLNGLRNQGWHQNSPGIAGGVETADYFGSTLTTGTLDIDGDAQIGPSDWTYLVIGVGGENIGSIVDAGMINLIYASDPNGGGLSAAYQQGWHLNRKDLLGVAQANDGLGRRSDSLFAWWNSPTAQYTPVEVPALSSLPGAPVTLYLDFNGHFEPAIGRAPGTGGSRSNPAMIGRDITPFVPVFDMDGNYSGFNSDELDAIEDIWARVAEDYSPFNVNVTTMNPGDFSNRNAMRVAIGGRSDFVRDGTNFGGLAVYFGSMWKSRSTDAVKHFDHPNVAWVFPDKALYALTDNEGRTNIPTARIATTVSHEAGHAFGLEHMPNPDWRSSSDPLAQYGKGSPHRTQIMGDNTSMDRTTWHHGVDVDDDEVDELKFLRDANLSNLGFRPDQHQDKAEFATSLGSTDAVDNDDGTRTYEAAGVINQATLSNRVISDQDWFKFDIYRRGRLQIDAEVLHRPNEGSAVAANLDIKIELYGLRSPGDLEIIEVADPTDPSDPNSTLDAYINRKATAGTYFLKVTSHGEYGDIGLYTLSVTVPSLHASSQIYDHIVPPNLATLGISGEHTTSKKITPSSEHREISHVFFPADSDAGSPRLTSNLSPTPTYEPSKPLVVGPIPHTVVDQVFAEIGSGI